MVFFMRSHGISSAVADQNQILRVFYVVGPLSVTVGSYRLLRPDL